MSGYRARTSAATPDTTAVAKLVPLTATNPSPPADGAVRPSPGAATSTQAPRFDSADACPAASTPATASTRRRRRGTR